MGIINNIFLSIQQDTPQINSFSIEDVFSQLKNLSIDDAISKIADSMTDFVLKLALAVIVFYVGKFIIVRLHKIVNNILARRNAEASLTTFILSVLKIVLYFILIVIIIDILGIETSSFLALFASAGVAIGMALSGTLQNFAGGVLILLLKPYKVGDYIEAQGFSGTVKEIQIFHTIINTIDNKAIIIPNGGLSTGSINNYSLEDYRRVDWTICLSYGTDIDAAKEKILSIIKSDDRVVTDYIEDDKERRNAANSQTIIKENNDDDSTELNLGKKAKRKQKKGFADAALNKFKLKEIEKAKVLREPFVALGELADNSINISVRAWTHSSYFWDLYFTMNERFYKELPASGFEFPYPQLDVHISDYKK